MKRIIVFFIVAALLSGCSTKTPAEVPVEKIVETPKEPVQEPATKPEVTEPEVVEAPIEEPQEVPLETPVGLTQDEFVVQTFANYGFTAPERSQWQFENQGPNKIAVIIKEPVQRGRPNISKLIFLWNGSAEQAEILHLSINNRVII
ncbi:membrane lipoprotein lipid attachment site-containing protein [Erysipelothrix anatis]|uniref:membrane lipoprotein lipid attachment site-containing protein n=1 Tax=Erysipelothrix anatis TaxID=2683713 RepID=UPI00135B6579|nr:membrane lipoprotein lipid attachment site-containing protein [Erysipelothrix anatis]